MRKNKAIIIGIDGVPYGLMEDLSDRGVMPNFKGLRKEGVFKKMRSSIPHISSVSWSSIITGKNPGEHGIFGFTDIIPGTYSLSFPDFNGLKSNPFWQEKKDRNSVILNVPSTYPVKKLNGVHISGFISLDLEKAVYPAEYVPKLEEIDYQIDVDSSLAHKSMTLFLEKLNEVNEARIGAYKYFWEKEDWDTFMFVFTGSDRIGHFLWSAYEDKNHKFHNDFLNYFRRVDEVIGEIADRGGKDVPIIIISDHGMERLKENVNLNCFLEQTGFLKLNKSLKGYNQIDAETKVFALDPGRIYLHRKDKYPRGSVGAEEEEGIIQELIKELSRIERKGDKVVKKIYRKEEIYYGPEAERAPDLVITESPGYRLKGNINKDNLFDSDIFTGDHSLEDSFIYLRSKESKKVLPDNPNVEDVVKTLNKII